MAILGTSGNDFLPGTAGDDQIEGLAGDDSLYGDSGDDILLGGTGDDFLEGGAGDDFIDGGANGTFGDNVSYFMSTAGVTVNLATGQATDGMGGNDTLVGVEHVDGSRYGDTLTGDAAVNWFRPDAGDDVVDGGGERDVVMYETSTSGVTIDLQAGQAFGAGIGSDRLVSIENAHASLHADTVTMSDVGGYVFGRAGDDLLRGGIGSDNFIGGSGNDTLSGGAGMDWAQYFDDNLDLVPPTGLGVTVNLSTGTATDNWGHTDTLVGIEGVGGSRHADLITGAGAANESFNGNEGNDTIRGGAGSDFIVGGLGDDVIDGGAVTDLLNYTDLNTVDYGASWAGIEMDLDTGIVQDGLGGTDRLTDINWVVGSSHADRITGSSGIYFEQFDGGLGDDTIDGGAIDPLTFNNSNRVNFFASGSAATVNLATGAAVSGLGRDTLININHVFGTRFGDTLAGSDSAITESFNGRGGNDVIDGAGGIDEVRYTNGGAAGVIVNLALGAASRDGEGGADTLRNIEGVRGSNFADVLTGGNAANDGLEFFMGMSGNDTIDGGSGYDRADYTSSTRGVTITLGGTADGSAADGFGTNDVLRNIEALRGSNFDDVLTGSDTIPFESFEGRAGDDIIDGRAGTDRADYVSSLAGVTVDLATGTASDGFGGTDTLVAVENARGSSFDDALTGNAGVNVLHGGAGQDALSGAAGDDVLAGGAGNDALAGGEGADQFVFAASGNGFDTVQDFARGDTLLVGGTITGRSSAGNGSTLLAGGMEVSTASGQSTLYIGTDAVAGADVAIRFAAAFQATDFIALATADGYTSIGLAEPSAQTRVAELAVQVRATSVAHADVATNVAGRSTTNEVAVARLLEALERVNVGPSSAGDFAGFGGDAPAELVGVPPLQLAGF